VTVSLLQLRYFLAVADHGGFTRAAERLGVSQPALSEQVRSLERILGTALFIRTTRNVQITDAGRALRDDLIPLVGALDAAVARAMRAGRAGDPIRIAYTASAGYEALPLILEALDTGGRPSPVIANQAPHADVLDAVRRADADAGLVREFGGAPGLDAEVVRREPLHVFMSDAHPLAGRRTIDLAELEDAPMLTVPARLAPGFHDRIAELCAARGVSRPAGELPAPDTREPLLAHLARNPDHVFVGPASMATSSWPGVVHVPLADAEATLALSLVWTDTGAGINPAAARVRSACATVAARAGWRTRPDD